MAKRKGDQKRKQPKGKKKSNLNQPDPVADQLMPAKRKYARSLST